MKQVILTRDNIYHVLDQTIIFMAGYARCMAFRTPKATGERDEIADVYDIKVKDIMQIDLTDQYGSFAIPS